jgi:hypothetical protein
MAISLHGYTSRFVLLKMIKISTPRQESLLNLIRSLDAMLVSIDLYVKDTTQIFAVFNHSVIR